MSLNLTIYLFVNNSHDGNRLRSSSHCGVNGTNADFRSFMVSFLV